MMDEKTLRKHREKFEKALAADRNDEAIQLLVGLVSAEPTNPRWPHKRGDLLRRAGRKAEAIACYEQAVDVYAKQGFIARAVAMAKTVLSLDPSRTDVLMRVDPQAAQQLHRQARPASMMPGPLRVSQPHAAVLPDDAVAATVTAPGFASKRHPMVLDDVEEAPVAAAPVPAPKRHPMLLDDVEEAPVAAAPAPKRHPMLLDEDPVARGSSGPDEDMEVVVDDAESGGQADADEDEPVFVVEDSVVKPHPAVLPDDNEVRAPPVAARPGNSPVAAVTPRTSPGAAPQPSATTSTAGSAPRTVTGSGAAGSTVGAPPRAGTTTGSHAALPPSAAGSDPAAARTRSGQGAAPPSAAGRPRAAPPPVPAAALGKPAMTLDRLSLPPVAAPAAAAAATPQPAAAPGRPSAPGAAPPRPAAQVAGPAAPAKPATDSGSAAGANPAAVASPAAAMRPTAQGVKINKPAPPAPAAPGAGKPPPLRPPAPPGSAAGPASRSATMMGAAPPPLAARPAAERAAPLPAPNPRSPGTSNVGSPDRVSEPGAFAPPVQRNTGSGQLWADHALENPGAAAASYHPNARPVRVTAQGGSPRIRPYEPPADDAELFSRALEAAIELEIAPDVKPNETRFSNAPPGPGLELSVAEVSSRPEAAVAEEYDAVPRAATDLSNLPLFPLFAEMPREVLAAMITETELIELSDGDYVIRRGDPGDALFGIVEGSVAVIVEGHAFELTLAEGDVFGESCLLQDEPRHADVRVVGRLTALRIPRDALTRALRSYPRLAELMLELLTRRLLGNLLQTSPLFQEFDGEGRRMLSRLFEVRRAPAGTKLAVAGKQMDGLYISLTGTLSVETSGEGSRIAAPGSMFGQHTLLSQEPAPSSVTARVNLVVLRLPTAAFSQVAMQYPTVVARLAELSTGDIVSVSL